MFLLELRPSVQEGLGRQEGEPGEARQHSSGLQVVEAELRIRMSHPYVLNIGIFNILTFISKNLRVRIPYGRIRIHFFSKVGSRSPFLEGWMRKTE